MKKYLPENSFAAFFKSDVFKGLLLLLVLLIVLIISNSPLNSIYESAISFPILKAENFSLHITVTEFVNDGLMVFFFLLLALEIKREILMGELANPRQVILPVVAASGGVIVPALIYIGCIKFLQADPGLLRGWATPVATDVALALGLLSLLGKRVPPSLKIFLSVLAIADDLIAIMIIGFFYTAQLSYVYLGLAISLVALLILINRLQIKTFPLYALLGIALWFTVYRSGIHPTIAGVIIGFCIPAQTGAKNKTSLLIRLEHILQPWVAFAIVPLFILMNAGISLAKNHLSFLHPIPLGIALGLFLGKQIGIFLTSFVVIQLGLASLPPKSRWLQLYGVSVLAGIGFTMSFFIAELSFAGSEFVIASNMAILIGSGLSALIGLGVLFIANKK